MREVTDMLWAAALTIGAARERMEEARRAMDPLAPLDPSDLDHMTAEERATWEREGWRYQGAKRAMDAAIGLLATLAKRRPEALAEALAALPTGPLDEDLQERMEQDPGPAGFTEG